MSLVAAGVVLILAGIVVAVVVVPSWYGLAAAGVGGLLIVVSLVDRRP